MKVLLMIALTITSIGHAQETNQKEFIKEVRTQGQLLLGNDFDDFLDDEFLYIIDRYKYNNESVILVSQISTEESKLIFTEIYCDVAEGDWALYSDPFFDISKSQASKFEFYIAKYKCN